MCIALSARDAQAVFLELSDGGRTDQVCVIRGSKMWKQFLRNPGRVSGLFGMILALEGLFIAKVAGPWVTAHYAFSNGQIIELTGVVMALIVILAWQLTALSLKLLGVDD